MTSAFALFVALAMLLAPGPDQAQAPALDAPTQEALAKVFDGPAALAKTDAPAVCILDIQHPEAARRHLETKPASEYGGRKLRAKVEQLTGLKCLLVHFTQVTGQDLDRPHLKAILITGRSKSFSKAQDRQFYGLIRNTRIPMIGFCGGMQLIGRAFAAKVAPLRKLRPDEKDPNPKYHPGLFKEWGFLPVKILRRDPLFDGLPDEIIVCERHAFQMTVVPPEFDLLASSPACRVQAIRHKDRVLYGTQFHPEAYDNAHLHGKKVLENFFRAAGIAPPAAKPPASSR